MKEYIVWICDGGDRFTRVLQTTDPVAVDHYITKNTKLTLLITAKVSPEELREDLAGKTLNPIQRMEVDKEK